MNHKELEIIILNDIEWREKELTTIKTLPLRRFLNQKEKDILYSKIIGFYASLYVERSRNVQKCSFSRKFFKDHF